MSWPIIDELQRRIEDLATKQAQMLSRLAETEQSSIKVWMDQGGGGGGGGPVALYCTPAAAIAGGGSGTADVYKLSGGSGVLLVTGATVYNVYASATTAGRVCTLADCGDGSYMVLAQSCT